MDLWTVLLMAVGLAMDCFAVSLGIGTTGQANSARPIFRLSFHFGFFQTGMCLLGWLAGSAVLPLIAGFDHWIALALLGFVGLRMIREGLRGEAAEALSGDPSRGATLIMLSVATSIDSLAVGLSLAMLHTSIWGSALVIGLVSAIFAAVGVLAGGKLGERFGDRMEIVGGLVLIGIGVRVVISHIL